MLRRALLVLACGFMSVAFAADKPIVVVLIGPTGAGKTTQTEHLRKKFGMQSLNVDDLLAKHPEILAKYTTDGIDAGTPETSPAANELIRDNLSKMDLTKGVVLDGYPATKDQADHLQALIRDRHLPPPVYIQLDITDNLAMQRDMARRRADDTPRQIEHRLKDYHRELDFIRSYYPDANIWTVDGKKSVPEVSRTIDSILQDEVLKK